MRRCERWRLDERDGFGAVSAVQSQDGGKRANIPLVARFFTRKRESRPARLALSRRRVAGKEPLCRTSRRWALEEAVRSAIEPHSAETARRFAAPCEGVLEPACAERVLARRAASERARAVGAAAVLAHCAPPAALRCAPQADCAEMSVLQHVADTGEWPEDELDESGLAATRPLLRQTDDALPREIFYALRAKLATRADPSSSKVKVAPSRESFSQGERASSSSVVAQPPAAARRRVRGAGGNLRALARLRGAVRRRRARRGGRAPDVQRQYIDLSEFSCGIVRERTRRRLVASDDLESSNVVAVSWLFPEYSRS